jgi:hypothetical protein
MGKPMTNFHHALLYLGSASGAAMMNLLNTLLKHYLLVFAISLAFVSAVILVYLLETPAFNDGSRQINPALADKFGSLSAGLLGPLLALATILLVLETLKSQSADSKRQGFESRFFEILNIQRRNVAEMAYRKTEDTEKDYKSRRVFLEIHHQLEYLLGYIKEKHGSEFKERELIDIAYLIMFFGPRIAKQQYLRPYIKKSKALEISLTAIGKIKTKDGVYRAYTGHQNRLGHYYRHLYQSVKYIDQVSFLSKTEKYDYVKTLRAQLSTAEQVIFFFNSLSTLGAAWGYDAKNTEQNLVVKYKLIKNISPGITFDVDPKKYYEMKFEFEEFPHIAEAPID